MKTMTDIQLLERHIASGAVFVLFGGPDCGVCQSLHPRLDAMLKEHYPDMLGVYIDCKESPEICAQYGVFSLPVVKVYIEGMLIAEEAGAFSIQQLAQALERPYSMWKQL